MIAQEQGGHKQLLAFYVPGPSQVALTDDELRSHLQQRLPEYMLPVAFIHLDMMPLTPNGKVDRRALEGMDIHLASSQVYVAPRNATEKQLAAIWAEVLGVAAETVLSLIHI